VIVSKKIAEMFRLCGFVNTDYLLENKIYVSPSVILNALEKEWRKWKKPLCMQGRTMPDGGKLLDPTFGYDTAGGTEVGYASDRLFASWFTCPESGTAQSITVYCRRHNVEGTSQRCVIYKKSDGSKIAETAEASVSTTNDWYSFSFSSPPDIENIDYWLGIGFDAEFGDAFRLFYDSESAKGGYSSITYPTFPDPWSPTTTDRIFSIYCTYTTAAPPTGWRKLQYYSEPPTAGAWNKLKYATEPPVAGAWNKLLYEGE